MKSKAHEEQMDWDDEWGGIMKENITDKVMKCGICCDPRDQWQQQKQKWKQTDIYHKKNQQSLGLTHMDKWTLTGRE